jgi:hypothetical protein
VGSYSFTQTVIREFVPCNTFPKLFKPVSSISRMKSKCSYRVERTNGEFALSECKISLLDSLNFYLIREEFMRSKFGGYRDCDGVVHFGK